MKIFKPTNQTAEVFYMLLTEKSINRASCMKDTYILNVTARIANLRNKHNINVICTKIKTTNKFGRDINYGQWHINSKGRRRELIKLYNIINQ